MGDPMTVEEVAEIRKEAARRRAKRERGLYGKFNISRTDGSSEPGEKHDGCDYFVLDVTHDPFAIAALAAYSDACRSEYPQLAEDLNLLIVKEWRP